MSFGNNVLFYRKKYSITQEALAEKLSVTRQTVSRWETDSAFPEMEKLIVLCELFSCDMETLVRGDAEAKDAGEHEVNLEAYDRHMNAFAAQITAGVCLILAGLVTILFMFSAGIKESVGAAVFLGFVAVAVAIFVAGGVAHGNFRQDNPRMEKYPEEKVRAFRRKLPFLIAGATALILVGLVAAVAMTGEDGYAPEGFTVETWEYLAGAVFMSTVAAAVGIYVCTGMLSAKYDVKGYNRECREDDLPGAEPESEGEKSETRKKSERISSAVCGVIMMVATIVYLLLGFLKNLWHPGWVCFVAGGIFCGIVNVIVNAVYHD